jgi:UPF0755 protein
VTGGDQPTRSAGSGDLPLWRRLTIMGASAFATLSLLFMLAVVAFLWLYQGAGPAAHSGTSTTVILKPGSGVSEIAAELNRDGVIRFASVFVVAAKVSGAGKHMRAGEYEFPTHASMALVMQKIRKGDIVRHWITIPEGYTSEAAVDVLANSDVLIGSAPIPAEGSILPETYEVRRGDDRGAVLQRMMTARDDLLKALWAQRQPGLPFQSPEQAMTMASIVEKETGLASERPRVAAVFINRLEKGIRLQTDPTVIYGLTQGKPLGRGLRESELQQPTPYNTYLINGLPPTPICNPGRASIAAVLDPPHTSELYFVASGTGGHVFASTLDEHNTNVAHYRQVERQAKLAGPQ